MPPIISSVEIIAISSIMNQGAFSNNFMAPNIIPPAEIITFWRFSEVFFAASSFSTPSFSGLTRTFDLLQYLIDDVYKSFEILDSDKESQYLRRVAVRTVFSFIEGIVQIVKFDLNFDIRHSRTEITLSSKEYELLHEVKIKDGEKFKIIIPLEQNLKRTFKLAGKIWGLTGYQLDTTCSQYTYFMYAKETRNKLAHPRTYYDIEISNDEMSYVAHAFEWVRQEFVKLISFNKLNKVQQSTTADG